MSGKVPKDLIAEYCQGTLHGVGPIHNQSVLIVKSRDAIESTGNWLDS